MVSGLKVERYGDAGLTAEAVAARLAWLREVVGPRLERFMGYYRNPTSELEGSLPCAAGMRFSVRPSRQYQELGLPGRLTGFRRGADGGASAVGAAASASEPEPQPATPAGPGLEETKPPVFVAPTFGELVFAGDPELRAGASSARVMLALVPHTRTVRSEK